MSEIKIIILQRAYFNETKKNRQNTPVLQQDMTDRNRPIPPRIIRVYHIIFSALRLISWTWQRQPFSLTFSFPSLTA